MPAALRRSSPAQQRRFAAVLPSFNPTRLLETPAPDDPRERADLVRRLREAANMYRASHHPAANAFDARASEVDH